MGTYKRYYTKNIYGKPTIRTWLNDSKRRRGVTRRQVEYIRDLKDIDAHLASLGVLTFFMIDELGIKDCYPMMYSAKKQRRFVRLTVSELKEFAVTPEYYKVFEDDIEGLRKRYQHVLAVCENNLRMTPHYPYFMEKGIAWLEEKGFDFAINKDFEAHELKNILSRIRPMMDKWEAEHQEAVSAHMEAVREEIETHEAWKAREKQKAKDEKNREKAMKKAKAAEEKEAMANARAYKKRMDKIEKEIWKSAGMA